MSIIDIQSRVGPDGKLTVSLPPSMANADVHVIVERAEPSPGHQDQDQWRAFLDRFAGSMPDFPDVERPGPESYEARDSLD
jgi:hypothetical protein